ncbi:MAG: alpha/beta hydrolase [Deltaproteobacteria bacterium]|nr:alpha/beta hydrolase [Deltaproteobacteria bacterium]
MSAEATARALLARASARRIALPQRGIETALLEWGSGDRLALLHHANGFCKGVWAEVATALADDGWRVIALDARGHGDSTHPEGDAAYHWDAFAEDLVALAQVLVEEHGGAPIALGLGHSFGGTSMIGAAARRPELFARLLLVDPVVPPPLHGVDPLDVPHLRKLIDGARKRRAEWASRDAARAWCAERRFFADWRPEAIELYLLDGMREHADGRLTLKCPGAVEGAVFAGSASVDLFALARRVATPTLVQWARRGDFPRAVHEALADTMAHAQLEALSCGHLVVMEQPELVIRAARGAP